MEHSVLYEKLKEQFRSNYITLDTLRGRVELYKKHPSKGITEDEFKEITGSKYTKE